MVLEKEAHIKNTEVKKSNKYFLELFSTPEDKKQIVTTILENNEFSSRCIRSIINENKNLAVDYHNDGNINIDKSITKNSILTPILTNIAISFYLKNYNILLHSYYDYTCCGLRHFGHINRVPYAGMLKENFTSFYKKAQTEFIEIDKILLLDLITRYNQFYLKGLTIAEKNPIKKLTLIKEDLKKFCTDNSILTKELIVRSTVGTYYANEDITTLRNYPIETIMKKWGTGEYLSNQGILFTYLHNSKLFQEKNRFINANSGNLVLEYEFTFNAKEYANQFLEFLESYEE